MSIALPQYGNPIGLRQNERGLRQEDSERFLTRLIRYRSYLRRLDQVDAIKSWKRRRNEIIATLTLVIRFPKCPEVLVEYRLGGIRKRRYVATRSASFFFCLSGLLLPRLSAQSTDRTIAEGKRFRQGG